MFVICANGFIANDTNIHFDFLNVQIEFLISNNQGVSRGFAILDCECDPRVIVCQPKYQVPLLYYYWRDDFT